MSQRDDKGKSPPDDRTLLDPLSHDELEALRQARQRLAKSKGPTSEPRGRQMVIGPDDGAIGDAPTRAMPALPSFDGRVSLDQIGPAPTSRVSGAVRDPATRGAAPSEPMSIYSGTVGASGEEPTLAPGASPYARGPVGGAPGQPRPPLGQGAGSTAGPTGFGENTLMWMQPPKAASTPGIAPVTADVLRPPPAASIWARLKGFLAFIAILALVGGVVVLLVFGGSSGSVELRTDPSDATISIDGQLQTQRTPVRLTMSEGIHEIEVSRAGFKPATVRVEVSAKEPRTEEVLLEPISAAGLMTIEFEVQPVAATISVDGRTFPSRRRTFVKDLDPAQSHKVVIEAPGHRQIEQTIAEGALKQRYTFLLQPLSGP